MTDTFQPGDFVTFEIDEYQADKFNQNTAIAFMHPRQIAAHTRPGEATPQKQEPTPADKIEVYAIIAKQVSILGGAAWEKAKECESFTSAMSVYQQELLRAIYFSIERARADLPGEGMKSAIETVREGLSNAVFERGTRENIIESFEKIVADARRELSEGSQSSYEILKKNGF